MSPLFAASRSSTWRRATIARFPLDACLVLVRTGLDRAQTWRERSRQRRQLAELDDARLVDLGLTRQDADREASKPFWRR